LNQHKTHNTINHHISLAQGKHFLSIWNNKKHFVWCVCSRGKKILFQSELVKLFFCLYHIWVLKQHNFVFGNKKITCLVVTQTMLCFHLPDQKSFWNLTLIIEAGERMSDIFSNSKHVFWFFFKPYKVTIFAKDVKSNFYRPFGFLSWLYWSKMTSHIVKWRNRTKTMGNERSCVDILKANFHLRIYQSQPTATNTTTSTSTSNFLPINSHE